MKRIPLTQNKFALVDDVDFEWLNQYCWFAVKWHNTFYATRNALLDGKQTTIKMHREILGLKNKDGIQIDHQDNDGLNNQHSNLRFCTNQQNGFNQRPTNDSSSYFKGVSHHKKARKWIAQISPNRKNIYLGLFIDEIEAAIAYDLAALKYFGEFAWLNFRRIAA